MALVRWEPFADLLRVQHQMNRMFEDVSRRGDRERTLGATWSPPVDIYEDPESFVIKVA